MTIYFLPIEPLEERYSAQMLRWVEQAVIDLGVETYTFLPISPYQQIQHGQWLDTFGTTRYRNEQLNLAVKHFEAGFVKNGDIFLVGDVWYPGIESLRLMADLSGVKIRIAGWHYAGTADPADLLHRMTGEWAVAWEHWLINYGLDAICVGSLFHKNMLRGKFGRKTPIYPFGLAWQPKEVRQGVRTWEKERIVVFPHRIAPEKSPESFYMLAELFKDSGWRFVVSTNNFKVADQVISNPMAKYVEVVCHDSKKAYYDFLATCSIYYSNATQETFGYALHEAIALGLSVVAPMRCSYSEMLQYDKRFLFDPLSDPYGRLLLEKRVRQPIAVPFEYTEKYAGSEIKFISQLLNS